MIPASVEKIGGLVFKGCYLEMNAWVEEGSYADKYCKANFINRLRPDGSKPEDEDD